MANETAFHLAPGGVSELRLVTRPHLDQLILFGAVEQALGAKAA